MAEVTTIINLLSLLCSKLGLDMKSKVGLIVNKFEINAERICRMLNAQFSKAKFDDMVSDLLSEFDLLDKWSKNENSGGKLNCGGSD